MSAMEITTTTTRKRKGRPSNANYFKKVKYSPFKNNPVVPFYKVNTRQNLMRRSGVKPGGVMIGQECKYVDGYLDTTSLVQLETNDQTWAGCELNPRQQTAVYGCLPVPRQGDNYSDRDGRKIYVKNIKIHGVMVAIVTGKQP